ncbi:restriction endonuclease [Mesorhizobium sp.]|uniref:restriction endonuclease n=1 Tax=Mesorhizobium sp. TaxID=1871066 RepID=UPI00122B5C1E|nr:restriction endonuclease [Mesorhizobium sp.]TIL42769.1 MAG: restriction endonuclease [Mesorhizobium sp.]
MPLITAHVPETWEQLEELVTAILGECGMQATRQVTINLPRGNVDVDVFAEESVDGIVHRIICECKYWKANIPKEIVHAFRTVMQETGANRGYIVSRAGFQKGAYEAAQATNIELVTFAEFQERYFDKWFKNRIWAVENSIGNFNTYYEPLGPPGWAKLATDEERAAYESVLDKYLFAGLTLHPFSPYLGLRGTYHAPPMPFDFTNMEEGGVAVPAEIKAAQGYRELLTVLENYARKGLRELRAVNPVTRGKMADEVDSDD